MYAQRYKLLAGAVAGRSVAVAGGADSRSWSDGETIFLRSDDDHPARDTLVVQAALLAAGSLDPGIVRKTTGRNGMRLRYLTLEAMRAITLVGDAVPRTIAVRV